VAVENDYNLLVHNYNDLVDWLVDGKLLLERLLLEEKLESLESNDTDWVSLILGRVEFARSDVERLVRDYELVLHSRPGEKVFDAEPPGPPDAPPDSM